MLANSTCVPGNNTDACQTHTSSAGLASGLTIFFLLLVIAACLIIYKYRSSIRNMRPFRPQRSVKKQEYTETPQADPHMYTSLAREQSTAQAPIYENLTSRANRQEAKQSRSSREGEQDVYLQCDVPDDVIYNNDPACRLSLLPDSQEEEDVYIVPDAL